MSFFMQLGWQDRNKYSQTFAFRDGRCPHLFAERIWCLPFIRRGLSWFHDEDDFRLLGFEGSGNSIECKKKTASVSGTVAKILCPVKMSPFRMSIH